ncbi:ATP adenylyltransferase [Myxococcaceae bacterium GXIMD 01537]
MTPSTLLSPEHLWDALVRTTRDALALGALRPIATDCHTLEDGGMRFQVRVLGPAHQKKKPEPPRAEGPPPAVRFDPFDNPEPALVVGDVTPTHLCLLNKFNVVEHHLLIITRAYEEQSAPLTAGDFEALALCLAGMDGLAFYNSSETAGASQHHKHLQLIPPLGPGPLRAPVEALLREPASPGPDFPHALRRLTPEDVAPGDRGARLLEAYHALRATLRLAPSEPYNLLATRDWMLLVPRAHARAEGINVNAMGFAGSLLVPTLQELQGLQRLGPHGPLALLQAVARAR